MKIDKDAFAFCDELLKAEIPDDSQLQTIDKRAFEGCTIENKSILHQNLIYISIRYFK